MTRTLLGHAWLALADRLQARGETRAAERLRAGLRERGADGPAGELILVELALPEGVAAAIERVERA